MSKLSENRYGKARVRVMKVERLADHHLMKEWSVRVLLKGDFESCFTSGDNSKILPTDTMKNTVYSLARDSKAATLEVFADELVEYLLANNPQVSGASVEVEEKSWKHIQVEGKPHATSYQLVGPEVQTTHVERNRDSAKTIHSGIDGLVILKTTNSEFTGYIKDKLTTLPETTDRIFATRATINWLYSSAPKDYTAAREKVLAILLKEFAEHYSISVQQSIYLLGDAVLKAIPEIQEIKMTMPNLHCLIFDLGRFGQDNPNQIFVPTDEPHGYIEATVVR